MIDLHLHLDGSLSANAIILLSQNCGAKLPTYDEKELKKYITAPKKCKNLDEYLQYFDIALSVLQTKDAIKYAMSELIYRLDDKKMRYAEIRFAPQLHTSGELSQEEAVAAAIEGRNEALANCNYMLGANIILCCMRGSDNKYENMHTVEIAADMLGYGIVSVDLAGAEGVFETNNFKDVFSYAYRCLVPFTIHAGEAAGADSVRAAIDMGARRIGHGLRAIGDDELMKRIIDNEIALEMCPTSNVQTGAIDKIKSYPICDLLEKGAIVTVNTDNMTVSDTDIKQEFTLLKRSLSLTSEQEKMLLLNSVYAAFLEEDKKKQLSEKIYERWLYV